MLCRRLGVGSQQSWRRLADAATPAAASAAATGPPASFASLTATATQSDGEGAPACSRSRQLASSGGGGWTQGSLQLPFAARAFHAALAPAARGGRDAGGAADGVVSGDVRARVVEEVKQMPRKQQEYTLNQILKGHSSLPGFQQVPAVPEPRLFDMHVVDVNRTVKVTKGGSLQRFSALVVVGNGNGVVGWAMGKAPEVGVAVEKAYSRASRSLFYLERFENHTIFHNTSAKYGRSIVHMAPLPSGSGVRANQTIQAVCRLAGIKDLRAKVHGSHNPHTTLRAVFEALDAVRTPEEIALATGRTVVQL